MEDVESRAARGAKTANKISFDCIFMSRLRKGRDAWNDIDFIYEWTRMSLDGASQRRGETPCD